MALVRDTLPHTASQFPNRVELTSVTTISLHRLENQPPYDSRSCSRFRTKYAKLSELDVLDWIFKVMICLPITP